MLYIFLDKKKFLPTGGLWLFFISPGWWIGNEQLFKVGLGTCYQLWTYQGFFWNFLISKSSCLAAHILTVKYQQLAYVGYYVCLYLLAVLTHMLIFPCNFLKFSKLFKTGFSNFILFKNLLLYVWTLIFFFPWKRQISYCLHLP